MTQLENAGSPQEKLPDSMSAFVEGTQARLGTSTDIIYRFITLGPSSVVVVYIEGMADPQALMEAIQEDEGRFNAFSEPQPERCLELLQERTISLGKVGGITNYTEVETELLAATRSSISMEARRRCLPVQKR